jgi:hypothetical protein
MALSYQITRFQIVIPLTEKQWNKLEKLSKDWIHGRVKNPIDIHKTLEAVGAQDVDWSGHYGQNIFFECDADWTESECGQSIVKTVVAKIEKLLQ